jgi:hypothetical protein
MYRVCMYACMRIHTGHQLGRLLAFWSEVASTAFVLAVLKVLVLLVRHDNVEVVLDVFAGFKW